MLQGIKILKFDSTYRKFYETCILFMNSVLKFSKNLKKLFYNKVTSKRLSFPISQLNFLTIS
jgi:hypothetical protein